MTRPARVPGSNTTSQRGPRPAVPPRTIHLIDIENLLNGLVTFERVTAAWQEYTLTVEVGEHDQIYVGFCPKTAAFGAFALPPRVSKLIGRPGKDSADLALTHVAAPGFIIHRFERAVIASADHHFTALAAALTRAGLEVIQVLGAANLVSPKLTRACTSTRRMPLRFEDPAGA